MKNYYEITSSVNVSAVDHNMNMRLDAIFNVMQDLTTFHSLEMKVDKTSLQKSSNAFFVLSKFKLVIKKLPALYEKVVFNTYPTEVQKIKFFREYKFSGDKGALIYARSEWCTLDYDTKALRLTSTVKYPNDIVHLPSNVEIPPFAPILCELEEIDKKYSYAVLSTDIDCNLHVNNVSYIKMAYNAFSPEEYANLNVKEVDVNFISQCYYGEQVDVYKKQIENKIYVFGKKDGKVVFKVLFTL